MGLQYETVEQSNWQKKIRVQISADRVEPKLEETIRDFQKRAKIEGFRKGKVPRQLVRKMFGPQIESQVYQPFIADAYDKIFKDEKFDVISSPEIEHIKFDKNQGLTFEIVFDVRPQFKIEDFDLTVEKVRFKVEKEDIEALLKELQEKNAMIYSADEAKEGHFVIADLQEVDSSGVPILGQKFEKQTIWLEEGNEEITPQLLGSKPGDERTIRITLPEEAESGPESEIITPSGEKAFKPTEKLFRVDVKEIKERKLPELDDEFAKDLGDYENIKTLKKELTKNLKERARYESENLFHQALVDELIKRNDIDVPPSMLQKYLDAVVEDMNKRSKETIDEKLVREQYKSLAIRNIKWILLRNQLVEQEALTVTDDEIETHLQTQIEEKKISEEEVKKIRDDKQRFEDYREQLLNDKVYTLLAERATIEETEKPWRQEQTDSETTRQPQKQS
jgi:trigger factor